MSSITTSLSEPAVTAPALVSATRVATPFAVLSGSRPAELARWLSLWQSWPGREVFAHPRYVQLFAPAGAEPLCACWSGPEGCVLYPFLLRRLEPEPFWSAELGPLADLVTPYGYGGPFAWGITDAEPLRQRFWQHFQAWAEQQGVVSEFLRFSLFPQQTLAYPGERRFDRLNVVCDLTQDEDVLWHDFKHKVRKNVQKAQRSGVRVVVDASGESLEAFLQIYEHTMQRRQAREDYYFGRSFFEQLQEGLPGQFAYFHALAGDRIISTELVLLSAEHAYSFLGGTESEAFELRPNDLIKFEIIRWAKSQGKHRFILGGGYGAEDGIFQYKLAFAPEGAVPFEVGRRILAPESYAALLEARRAWATRLGQSWQPRADFFPAYRS